uniref:Uncharacterized protein n=1 Tax=viral metagenome TaxID=1070528 RepID=A0A6M3K9E9_9ZZZZ
MKTSPIYFKQRSAKLYNGQRVRPGDKVKFTNSDGEECVGTIQYDVNNLKRLYFWNNGFDIRDYENAERL